MKNKMSLLYVIHINWNWICQRPQFLAMEISKYINMTIVDRYVINKSLKGNTKNPIEKTMNLKHCFQLPKAHIFKMISRINTILEKICIKKSKSKKYSIIWITHPDLIDFIPLDFNGLVIYDCMDNYVEMSKGADSEINCLKEKEKKVIKNADIVIASSQYLVNKIQQINNKVNVHLVRNAYNNANEKIYKSTACKKDDYTIAYIGTIADWFDFELIESSLNTFSKINYILVGPCQKYEIENTKVHYTGSVKHSDLYKTIKDADCLIMPFKICETVLAVDPVKLYEYISYGKCIISRYYPEIDRFRDYVYFYNTPEEYSELLLEKIDDGFQPKYNTAQQFDFLKQNTWECRGREVWSIIKNMEKSYDK